MIYYILWIHIYGDDWENEEYVPSLSKIELENYQKDYDKDHRNDNGYIPNIESINYEIIEYSEKQIRKVLTVDEYLKLRPDIKFE